MSDLKLTYIKPIGKSTDGLFDYQFFFTDNISTVYGTEWEDDNPSICDNVEPFKETVKSIEVYRFPSRIKTIEENSCFSMEYGMNKLIAIGWLDLEGLEEYPEKGRFVAFFGEDREDILKKIKNTNAYKI